MAVKTFYKSISGKQIARLYEMSLTSRDGTAIPTGSTVTKLTWRLWMSRTDGVSSGMKFYYWADYEKCNSKSSSDKYYYIGSSNNHHNGGNSSLKSITRLDSDSVKDMSLAHNYTVSFSASELTDLNKSFIASRCIGVTTISDTQIRCASSSSYSSDSHYCWGIELDIEYTPPAITPGNPTFTYPAAASRTTYNTKPWFRFKSGTNATKFYYRVDSASWQSFSCSASTTYDKQWPTALSAGSHTLYIYNTSSTSTVNSAGTTGTSRTFTVATPQAAVSAGAVIDDATIDGLQTNIRNQQYYYGQTQTTFTACNLGTVILDDYIDAMETAIEALPHPTSLASVNAGDSIKPTAFNNIRSALLNA